MYILSEGPNYLAIFKRENICVVRGQNVKGQTLLDNLRANYGKNIFPVHRLDKDTSGIVLFAKSKFAQMAIENAFKKRLVKKTYYAICEGKFDSKEMTIEKNLKKQGKIQTICPDGEKAKTIVSFIKMLKNDLCLLKVSPITGRMHQIRIHLSSIGLPIIGDKIYGKKEIKAKKLGLCAVKLSLPGPKGEKIAIDASDLFLLNDYLFD